MLIKKITFAFSATLLVLLAVIVLWRYQVEIEPIVAAAGPEAEHSSAHFQIVFLLSVLGVGLLLLSFTEAMVFRPIARLASYLEKLLRHEPDERVGENLGLYRELAHDLELVMADMKEKDATLREKDVHLNHRLRVEEALAKVARNLLRDPKNGVSRSLRILGRNLDTDVVSYWQLTRDGETMRCMGTFRDFETGEFSGEFDFEAPTASWISEAIHYEQHLIIDDVNRIPPEMEVVKEFISEYDLKSFLGVPLKVPDSNLGGLVAFGNIKSVRQWSKEDLRALEVVAELLTDYINRYR